MSGCLSDLVAALVDGELDHAAREKAQRHLAHCDACRAEVDRQRRLKARLGGLGTPPPSAALTTRLLGLAEAAAGAAGAAPGPESTSEWPSRPEAHLPAGQPGPVRPGTARPAPRAAAAAGPGRRSSRPRRRRRAAAGSAIAVLGVAAALALGAPPQSPASTPVDPATDAFVTEFVSTTADGVSGPRFPVPTGVGATFAPVTRDALLTPGGDRGSR